MSDGDDKAVVMRNANVNRHGLAPSIKQRLGGIQALYVRLDQRSYPGLPIGSPCFVSFGEPSEYVLAGS